MLMLVLKLGAADFEVQPIYRGQAGGGLGSYVLDSIVLQSSRILYTST
jgi:hypothetical protein